MTKQKGILKIDKSKYHTQKHPEGIYIHPWLRSNLEDLKDAVLDKDWDGVILLDGMEGSGKSTIAQQIGGFLDPTLSVDNIVWGVKEFEKACRQANKASCIIWDEGDVMSGNVMKKRQKALKRMMQTIREKNLFIIVCAPYIFDLQQYWAVNRTRCLIHVYAEGFKRGQFEFYGYQKKRLLYFKGKRKYWNYNVQKPDFLGKFHKGYYVDEEKYREKKREYNMHKDENEKGIKEKRNEWMINLANMFPGRLTQKEISEVFELDQSQVSRILNSTN